MAHFDQKPELFGQGLPKNGQGVRGGVAYRRLSDSYANDKNYPRWLYAGVNGTLFLLALLLLLALLWIFTPIRDLLHFAEEKRTLSYTLEVYDATGDIAASSAVGTSLIDPETGETLGEITAAVARPTALSAALWRTGCDEADNVAPTPAKIVTLTVSLEAYYSEANGYSAGDIAIAEGRFYTVLFAGSVSEGVCILMEEEG